MVLQLALAGLGAAGSIFSGLSARSAAKSTQKRQAAADLIAKTHNTAEIKAVNRRNWETAKWLNKQKEVTTEVRSGTDTQTASARSSVDIAGMMAAAEASGINPITFLRNGGLAAYVKTDSDQSQTYGSTTTTTRKGHNAVAVAQLRQKTPDLHNAAPVTHVPGAGEAVGQGVSQFANAVGDIVKTQNAQDFLREQAEAHQGFQRELMMMSLGGVQKGGAIPGGRSFYTPGFSTSGGAVTRQTQGGLSGGPQAPTAGEPSVTNPYKTFHVDPTVRDGSAWSDRYGEPGEWIAAPYVFGMDMNYNLQRWRNTPEHKADAQKVYDALPEPKKVRQFFKDLGGYFNMPAWMQ